MTKKKETYLWNAIDGIVSASFVLLIGKIIQFFFLLKLAFVIDQNQLVMFFSALAIGQVFGIIIIPGGQQGLTALIAKAVSQNDSGTFRSIFWMSIVMFLCFVLLLIVMAILSKYINFLDVLYKNILYFLVVLIGVFSILRSAVTRGCGFIFKSLFYIEVAAPFVLLILLHTAQSLFDIIPFSVIWFAAYLTFELISIYVCKEPIINLLNGPKVNLLLPKIKIKHLLTNQISNTFMLAVVRLDVVLLAAISGPSVAAPYILVNKFVQPITLIARVLSNSTATMIAQTFAKGNVKESNRLTFLGFLYVLISLFTVFILIYFSFEYLRNYFDSKYDLTYEVFFYLTVAYVFMSLGAPFSQNLIMTNKAHYLLVIHMVAFIVFYGLVFVSRDNMSADTMAKFIFALMSFVFIASLTTYILIYWKKNLNKITNLNKNVQK